MNDRNENIFEIIDGLINQLNNTKRLFIILILTVMIIPPIVFVVSFELLNPPSLPPFNHHYFRNGHHNGIIDFIDLGYLIKHNAHSSYNNWYCVVSNRNKAMDRPFQMD